SSTLGGLFAAFGGGEGVAASTALGGIGVVDLEPCAAPRIVEIDGGALQILVAGEVHDHLHAVRLDNLVLGRGGLIADFHSVAETGTAAPRDEHADTLIGAAVLLHDGLDLGSRFFAQ